MNYAKRQRANLRHARSLSAIDERDMGISPDAAAVLGEVFAEIDANPVVVVRHFVTPPPRELSSFTPRRSACGIDGLVDQTGSATSTFSSVTCNECRTTVFADRDRRALNRLRAANSIGLSLQFGIDRDVRERLVAAGLATVIGGKVVVTNAGKSTPKPKKTSTPKLTAEQQKRVRSLIEDENHTRASAIAWVTTFEADEKGAA